MLVHQCYRGREDAARRVNSFGEVIPRLVLGEEKCSLVSGTIEKGACFVSRHFYFYFLTQIRSVESNINCLFTVAT